MKSISKIILRILGWKIESQLPPMKKYVLIAYPHTSNWDFVLGMLAKWAMEIPLNWVAKHSLFWGPFKPFFIAMGGVPINRNNSTGFIENNIELFNNTDNFVLGLMPEGTRSKKSRLKSGFYYIATGANVPIALGYLDYKNKKLGIGKVIEPSGNLEFDFEIIKEFYQNMVGYHPQNQSELDIKKT